MSFRTKRFVPALKKKVLVSVSVLTYRYMPRKGKVQYTVATYPKQADLLEMNDKVCFHGGACEIKDPSNVQEEILEHVKGLEDFSG